MTRTMLTSEKPVAGAVLAVGVWVMAVFAFLAVAGALAADAPSATSPTTQPQFTPNGSIKAVISKETTYLTEPVLPDGTIDYLKAINDKASQGVTKENNAAVVLFEVFGPKVLDEKIRAEFFKRLDITPPADGSYFAALDDFAKAQMPGKSDTEIKKAQEALTSARDAAINGPWAAGQHPQLAAWLAANDPFLDKLVEASHRPRYFAPNLCPDESQSVLAATLHGMGEIHATVNALACRTTLRLQAGDLAGAQADALAILRWGQLIKQEPFLIAQLVGLACQSVGAFRVTLIAQSGSLTSEQDRMFLAQVNGLPAGRPIADALLAERFMQLDVAAVLQRDGTTGPLKWMQLVSEGSEDVGRPASSQVPLIVDYTALMRRLNQHFDLFTVAWSEPSIKDRVKAGGNADAAVRQIKESVSMLSDPAQWRRFSAMAAEQQRAELTPVLADYLTAALTPSLSAALRVDAKVQTQLDLARVALALAGYHAERQEYPQKLSDLAPAYLKEIPQDLFIDQPLHYQRPGADKGYLLYSVGPDMRDDQAAEKSDDIVVKTPP